MTLPACGQPNGQAEPTPTPEATKPASAGSDSQGPSSSVLGATAAASARPSSNAESPPATAVPTPTLSQAVPLATVPSNTAGPLATAPDFDSGVSPAPFEGKELFILFGQSNMSGFTPMPDEPWVIDENITFMVQYDCPRLGQTKDEWLPAEPPLHGCQWATNGLGLGLSDYFGRAMAAAWPTSHIGLIPNAIPAVTIDIFMPGGPAPEGAMKALPEGYDSAYTLMIDRAREAQKLGRIRAILLNQGESDFNQGFGEEWPDKVASLVADLRTELGLGEATPFVAGEVPPTGNYSGHNVNVHKLPDKIPNCTVVSGEGTDVHDGIHYDQASVLLMGERYAAAVLDLL